MKNYIVRIESKEEWKNTINKALELGYDWFSGHKIDDDFYERQLVDKEDVFLFLNGSENLDSEYTNPNTIQWDLVIPTEEDVDYTYYQELSAQEFAQAQKRIMGT